MICFDRVNLLILHNYAKLTCSLFDEPLLCKRNRNPEIDFTVLISTAAKVTSDEIGKCICDRLALIR